MRVLILTNKVPYPANDGSSIAIKSITSALLENGVDVKMLSINTKKHFKKDADIQSSKPEGLDFNSVYCNTSPTKLGAALNLFSSKSYFVSRFYQKNFAIKLTETLQNEEFDIIQLEGLSMAVYLPLLHKNTKAKICLRAHNVEFLIWQRHIKTEDSSIKAWYLLKENKKLEIFEKLISESVDAILPITEKDKSVFESFSNIKMMSLPCGINQDLYIPKSIEKPSADIAYLASFDWLPNVQGLEWFLEEVWPLVIDQRPGTILRIGGKHMNAKLKSEENKNIQISTQVSSMPDFINDSKLCIIPLLAGSGMRIKLLEYASLGKAIVSTQIGAEGIDLKNKEEIMIADSNNDFAEAILTLLDNDVQRKNMGERARNRMIQSFDNNALGKNLKNFYSSL